MKVSEVAWLDVTVMRCPGCGRCYAEASWYAIEMESDLECGECGEVFNSKKHAVDRVLVEFEINANGKAADARINMHLSLEK